jgi:hypothetical protein
MSDFTISPYVGAGAVTFGMTPAQVREAVGYEPKTFHKTPMDTYITDAFLKDGIQVSYGDNGSADTIEFNGPTRPEFMGMKFLGMSEKAVKSWLDKNDRDAKDDLPDSGWTSPKYGMRWGVDKGKVYTVLVFKKGYTDV